MNYQSVIFLHIPKSAGTTLHSIIARQYPRDAVLHINNAGLPAEEFATLPEERRRALRCIKGHMAFGLHPFMPQPCTYITLLRDPVERIVSHFYYIQKRPLHYLHEKVKSGGLTLEDYVRSDLSFELVNGQTALLAGVWNEPLSPDALDIAKRNLEEHFAVAGLMERFDESLLLMRRALGWKSTFYVSRNRAYGRPAHSSLPSQTRALIEERNQLDIELYEFVRLRFEQQLAILGDEVTREMARFARGNRVFAVRQEIRRRLRALLPRRASAGSKSAAPKNGATPAVGEAT